MELQQQVQSQAQVRPAIKRNQFANPYITKEDMDDTLNLAKARVFHFQQQGWTMFNRDELIGAAYEGIAEACIRFDPSKGTVKDTKFSSYAYFWIDKYIREYITNNKSMLSGSTAEKWLGLIPYVGSIDMLDDKKHDQMGSDHQAWMQSNSNADSDIELTEKQKALRELCKKIFAELEPLERTVMQLSIGVGVINNEPMPLAMIAKSTRMTKLQVQEIINSAYATMRKHSDMYEQFMTEFA